jgi:hypothetical protein
LLITFRASCSHMFVSPTTQMEKDEKKLEAEKPSSLLLYFYFEYLGNVQGDRTR